MASRRKLLYQNLKIFTHNSLVPVTHNSLVPVTHNSLVPVTHNSLVPVTHNPLVPVTRNPLVLVNAKTLHSGQYKSTWSWLLPDLHIHPACPERIYPAVLFDDLPASFAFQEYHIPRAYILVPVLSEDQGFLPDTEYFGKGMVS